MVGAEDCFLIFSGSGLLSPQSLRYSEEGFVTIACLVGNICVAVEEADLKYKLDKSLSGAGIGGGKEKNLDERRILAVGEVFAGILVVSMVFGH